MGRTIAQIIAQLQEFPMGAVVITDCGPGAQYDLDIEWYPYDTEKPEEERRVVIW